MLGYTKVTRFMLVAYQGKKILKQWGQDLSWEYGAISNPSEYMAQKHWSEAKSLGADRLCVTVIDDTSPGITDPFGSIPGRSWGPNNLFICYNGKTFSQPVHTENKPTVTCGPGQVPYQHPDGSWGCEGAGLTPTPAEFVTSPCPPGQHYSAPLKKCVPYKKQQFSPYNRGGMMRGVEDGVDWDRTKSVVAGVDGLEVTFEQRDGTLGAVRLPYRK